MPWTIVSVGNTGKEQQIAEVLTGVRNLPTPDAVLG